MSKTEGSPAIREWKRFWFEYGPPTVQVNAFRVAFFGVLGLDAWRQVSHAPRYGAGGFNVGHLAVLDHWLGTPQREILLVVFLLQAYLSFRVAAGVASRWSVLLLTGLFAYSYFCSELDSYQHHYLVFLLLLVGCSVDWSELTADSTGGRESREPKPDPSRRWRSAWALRLVLVQISLVYFWAAITKLHPAWLDGTVLGGHPEWGWLSEVVAAAFVHGNDSFPAGWATVSKATVALELFLAVGIHHPRLRVVAAPLGILFHLTIEAAGFRIGLFSWFMAAIYILVLPESWVIAAARNLRRLSPRQQGSIRTLARKTHRAVSRGHLPWIAMLSSLALGAALLVRIPFSEIWAAATAMTLLAVGFFLAAAARDDGDRRGLLLRHARVHLLSCMLLLLLNLSTSQARDYYRFWGGDARRRGEYATAIRAYSKVVEVAPTYPDGYIRLGDLYLQSAPQKAAAALAAYRRARTIDPENDIAWAREADLHFLQLRSEEAREAAQRALSLNPANRQATRVLARLSDHRDRG